MKRKIFSILLILALTLCMTPAAAFADETDVPADVTDEIAEAEAETTVTEADDESTVTGEAETEVPAEQTEPLNREALGGRTGLDELRPWTPKDHNFKIIYVAKVNFTSQMSGEFLHTPKFGYNVSSNLAESYGYTDVSNGVSVLDVLVSAHKLVYGSAFTKNTAQNYLTVANNSVTMQFGNTAPCRFFVNHAPATNVTKLVSTGDLVEFFFLEDADSADMYNWFTNADGEYGRTYDMYSGEFTDLIVKGIHARYADVYATEADMVNSANAEYVNRAQVYTVNTSNGALTKIDGALTNTGGRASLYFEEPGTYWITAKAAAGCTFKQILTLTKVNVTERPVATANVDFTSQASGEFLHAPQFGYEVSGDLAEAYGYADDVDGVSALDVLVAAHELIFGDEFTADTAQNYLTLNGHNVIMQFGSTVGMAGLCVNRGPAGNVATEIHDGDLVEFFYLEGPDYSDMYNWFTDADGNYSRNFTMNTGELNYLTMWGSPVRAFAGTATEEELMNSPNVRSVPYAQLYTVDIETGALAKMEGMKTNSNGKAYIYFDEPGEYWITAHNTSYGQTAQILTLTKITVSEHELVRVEPKAATCEEPGNIEYWTCTECGKVFSDPEGTNEITPEETVIPAAGHVWGPWKITKMPTSTQNGEMTRTCSVCHKTQTRILPKIIITPWKKYSGGTIVPAITRVDELQLRFVK